jgi:Ser/Thr protein kinase RdoA (MazF antagonist)
MPSIPNAIIRQFSFPGDIVDIHLCKFGHINDTFVVQSRLNGRPNRFILQRINHHVFRQPETLMSNIVKVTAFLRQKIEQEGGNPDRETLTLVPTKAGRLYHRSSDGDYWRSYRFIDGARSYMQVTNPEQLYQAARAFGRFMRLLDDFPAEALHETIPDFHHTPKRFRALMRAVEEDAHNRAHEVRDLIAMAAARTEKMGLVLDALEQGGLPRRVTHNDTKFNNVLIDDITGEGICVVDLDTVMPGSALFDFGDFVNTSASNGAEDERDLEKVSLNLDYFDAIVRGYLQETQGVLTPQEREWLPFSAWLITFELAMRFLTDYLNGDVYFRIHRPGHNLDRARSKFALAADMEANEDAMRRIITRYR